MNKLLSISAALLILSACAPQTLDRQDVKSYQVGQTLTASVGSTLLKAEEGTISETKHWVGVLNSPTGWQTDKSYQPDFVAKELIYSGLSGRTIKLTYREFRGGYAAPPFYQTVEYDLNQSNTVTFQNFVFEVLSADNQKITAELLRD